MAGRVRDGIGITVYHKGYKSNPEGMPYDKYDGYLQDYNNRSTKQKNSETEKIKQRNESDNTFIRHIQNMNFLSVWTSENQTDKCVCEGIDFGSKEKLAIKYRKDGIVKEILVSGKICKDCGRKIVVKKLILDAYHKAEG